MKVTKETLHQRYSCMETDQLVELQYSSDLTDIALEVLERILIERGVTSEDRTKVIELLEEEVTQSVPLASIGSRFVAQLIDAVIAFIILIVPLSIFGGDSDVGLTIAIIAYFLYLLLQDGLPNGQSIGKHFLNIAVVNKVSGKSCGIGASIVRNSFLLFLGFIDIFFLGSQYRQRLGDMAANTIVINVEKR